MTLKIRRREKLNDKLVKGLALSAGEIDLLVWDTDLTGLALRVRPGGKTWLVGYRPTGSGRGTNFRKMKLGSTAVLGTVEARKLARETLGRIANGADPLAERQAERRREKHIVATVIESFDARLQQRRYKDRRNFINELRLRMKPHLHRDLAEMTSDRVIGIIEGLERAEKPGAAKSFRRHAHTFFEWCVKTKHILQVNPLTGFRKERSTRAELAEQGESGRALNDAEIGALWNAAGDDNVFGRLVRFLLLSGCRSGEGVGLSREMLNAPRRRIDLPRIFVKQGRPHLVHLTPAIERLLDRCEVDSRSSLVFPSPKTGAPMSGFSKRKAALVARSGVDFKMHDLRKTFRSGLRRVGVTFEIAEIAIGHKRPELVEIYEKLDADIEEGPMADLRTAFERWSVHVLKVAQAHSEQSDVFA